MYSNTVHLPLLTIRYRTTNCFIPSKREEIHSSHLSNQIYIILILYINCAEQYICNKLYIYFIIWYTGNRMNSQVLANLISQQSNFNFLKLSTISKSCAEEHLVEKSQRHRFAISLTALCLQ